MSAYTFAGAARGLSEGLDVLENQRRERRQETRQDAYDKRQVDADERNKVTYGQEVRLNNAKISEAEAKAHHDEFLRKYDDGMGRFISSNGEDTQALEGLYNDHYPDDNQVKITRDPTSKKYTLDFGEGRVQKDLAFEDVVGMGSYMRDPEDYQKNLAKSRERQQKNQDEIAKEERRSKNDLKKSEVEHGYRMSEKGTPGAVAPQYKVGDDGNMYRIEGTTAQPVQGPAGGLTFRGADKGKDSAMVQEINTIAEKLPPAQGESPNARWMRAAGERAKLIGKTNPDQAIAEYEKALTAKLLDPSMINSKRPEKLAEAQAVIKQMTEEFAQRNYGARTPPNDQRRDGQATPGVYHHPKLGDITDADLEATAQKHGITVDEVKQQLGIQ